MNTLELQRLATDLLKNFDGVFSINQLPMTHKKSYIMIINTDPSNLPGTHWIAVIVRSNKTGFIFDSFGRSPPLFLQHWLNIRGIQWTANTRQVQPSDSIMCGQYCIYFLWFATSSMLNDEHFNNIMNILFPINTFYTYYDSIVNDFANVMKL